MPRVDPTIEIQKIRGVLSNFSWNLVKQVITEQEVTLTITKDIPSLPEDSDHEADKPAFVPLSVP